MAVAAIGGNYEGSSAKGGRLKTHQLTQSVIVDPEVESAHAVVLYGGLFGWEGAWFLHEIPTYMKVATVFCLPKHYTNDCSKCLDELHSKVDPSKIASYSLCGYSRGGIEVYRYRTLKPWRLLGLIDPSAPTLAEFQDEVLDGFSDKIRCVYWVPNWGKGGYGGRVPRFAQHLRDLKVRMVEQATEHEFMPALFFDVYHKEFIL